MTIIMLQTVFCLRAASIRGVGTGDAGVKVWQVQSLLHTGQLTAPIDYPGAAYDPDHQYSPFVPPWFLWQNDQPYSEYTSPFIWASAPLYALFDHAGLLIIPWLSGALLVIVAAWLAWRVSPTRWASLVPIVVGVGSPLLIYSTEFWEHTLGTLLAVLALALLVKANDTQRPTRWLIGAGAAIGLSLTMRAELYVYPVAVFIGWMMIRRSAPESVTMAAYSLREVMRRVVVPDGLGGPRRSVDRRAMVAVRNADVGQPVGAACRAEHPRPGRRANADAAGRYDRPQRSHAVAHWRCRAGHADDLVDRRDCVSG